MTATADGNAINVHAGGSLKTLIREEVKEMTEISETQVELLLKRQFIKLSHLTNRDINK